MKKFLIFAILIVIALTMCGCDLYEPRHDEWISPDGVHYWTTGYAMAPRFDNNGDLVIDVEED